MSEDEPDHDPETEAEAEESADDEGTNSPVVEAVKESDGETVNPNQGGEDDATTGDGGASDGE